MQRVGNILKQFIRGYSLERGLRLERIKAEWVNLVGDTIATHTYPQRMEGKTIFITVDTPQWMHHLSFYKEEILEKLQPYGVEAVRFKIGNLPEKIDIKQKITLIHLTDEDSRYIENAIKNIKDEELKEKLRVLLTHGLAAQVRKKF